MMEKIFLIFIIFSFLPKLVSAQLYTEKQTRHRFAQLTLGLDYQTSIGGKTRFLDVDNNIQSLDLASISRPRILLGGTHFWGHADIYIAIPIAYPTFTEANQEANYYSGVETVFKYYPIRIENNKLRPYIGIGLTPFYFEQDNNNLSFGNGPELNHTAVPLYTGFTFNKKNHLVELGLMWNYSNTQDYYISRSNQVEIETPPIYVNLSYRLMLDTTLGGEKVWESGDTEKKTQQLEKAKKLNSFYIGAGLSSAFWTSESSYNTSERPYIEKYSTSIMPDFTLGYYFHKTDLNFAVGYRGYGSSTNTYGTIQQLNRRSLILEATKFLFDYHGFVPFIGPAISHENLRFKESFERQLTQNISENKMTYGLTFGWDIRPDRIQSFILRTNLRWFPNLYLEVENDKRISFNNIEFNFIQLIVYPNRIFK